MVAQAQYPTDPVSIDTLRDVPEDGILRMRVTTWDSTWKLGFVATDKDTYCRLVAPGVKNRPVEDMLYPLSRILELQASVTDSKGQQQWHPIRLDLALQQEPTQCRPAKRAAGG
jgi:hypothetical protein